MGESLEGNMRCNSSLNEGLSSLDSGSREAELRQYLSPVLIEHLRQGYLSQTAPLYVCDYVVMFR